MHTTNTRVGFFLSDAPESLISFRFHFRLQRQDMRGKRKEGSHNKSTYDAFYFRFWQILFSLLSPSSEIHSFWPQTFDIHCRSLKDLEDNKIENEKPPAIVLLTLLSTRLKLKLLVEVCFSVCFSIIALKLSGKQHFCCFGLWDCKPLVNFYRTSTQNYWDSLVRIEPWAINPNLSSLIQFHFKTQKHLILLSIWLLQS